MEPTNHRDLQVAVVIHLQNDPVVAVVILEVQDQVSGLPPVVDPQVLSQEVREVVAPAAEQEVEEETNFIESGLSNPDYHKKWKSGLSLYC